MADGSYAGRVKSPQFGYGEDSPLAAWPFGEYYRSHEDLAGHLHDVGRRHAKRALLLYTSQDEFEQLDAAYSVGLCVELLSKSLLASVNPALLIPKDADALTILKYVGTKVDGVGDLDAMVVRSLEASKSIERLRQVKLLPPWTPADNVVFQVRNASSHLGVVNQSVLRAAIRPMVRFAEYVRVHYQRDLDRWWGTELATIAPQMVQADALEWQEVVAAKLAAARTRFAELKTSLPSFAAQSILTSMEGFWRTTIEHNEKIECPACGFRGWATGDVDRGAGDTEYAEDGWPTFWSVLNVTHFECNVCGLEPVDEVEVQVAGMKTEHEYPDEDLQREPNY